ncbi:MAG: GntR family transcriptional regulator, partial [Thiomonas sp. 14-64-326]
MDEIANTVNLGPEAGTLQRHAATTLAEQLSAQFSARIRNRLLPPGSRLPSVRECARRYGLSTQTVVAAYDRLQALGLVEARAQRGYFVRAPGDTPVLARPRATQADAAAPMLAPTHATALVRGMFHQMGAGAAVALRGAPG